MALRPFEIDTRCVKIEAYRSPHQDSSHAWMAASGLHTLNPQQTDRDKPTQPSTSCRVDRVTEQAKKRLSLDSRDVEQNLQKSDEIRCRRISRSSISV